MHRTPAQASLGVESPLPPLPPTQHFIQLYCLSHFQSRPQNRTLVQISAPPLTREAANMCIY